MIKDKYETLTRKLIEATGKGTVEWEKTSANNEFQARLGNNAVSISFFDPGDFASILTIDNGSDKGIYYCLSLINSEGKMIDCEIKHQDEYGYERLKDLYSEARRKFFKVDETLDEILKNL